MVRVTAFVLAGERPEGDPLAAQFGVSAKALIPVGGEAMGTRVVRTLGTSHAIGSVRVLGNPARLSVLGGVTVEASGRSIAATIRPLVATMTGPMLITTADHPLLDAETIAAFVARAEGCDVAVGVVERGAFRRTFPHNHRTWLRFGGGAYSGANLFWVGSTKVLPLLDIWAGVEQRRKRGGRALIGAFGPVTLAGVSLRLLSIAAAMARIGRRFGLSARAVVLDDPRACIDVDSIADHALVEAIIAAGAPAQIA